MLKVISIEGNKVKLGISADKNISIIRYEIIEAVTRENLSAGQSAEESLNWSITAPQPDQN